MTDRPELDPADEICAAADALAMLAMTYGSQGAEDESDRLYRLCADLELRSPKLQACWGGPLNGQVGRQRIMDDLIDRYRPSCIIETGTFRGLTTNWLAERFQGPILSCEASLRYFYQAKSNLMRHKHVEVYRSDSRRFLASLDAAQPSFSKPLIYLDAHWEQDLPLREEFTLIKSSFKTFVIVVDDFKVPGDRGYAWDDYGHGDALTIGYFTKDGLEGCEVFFPTLRSDDETGAHRGCCVIARDVPLALGARGLLRGATLAEWFEIQARDDGETMHSAPASSPVKSASALEQASYPDQIVRLRASLQSTQAEAAAKEALIHDLKRTCDDRQRAIDDLVRAVGETTGKEAVIRDLKRICDDRQRVIDDLVQALKAEQSRSGRQG